MNKLQKPNWLERTAILIVVLAGALAMSPSVADPDLWGHVQFGRDVLNEGWFPETNPYTFNSPDHRWINHENFSEVVMAWTVDNLGPQGLVFGKFALSLLVIITILVYNARRGVELVPNCIVALLVAWNLGYHWSFRPQISSFICFTLLVMLLNGAFTHWRDKWHLPIPGTRWFSKKVADPELNSQQSDLGFSLFHIRLLWLAPVLFFLWANSHGGFIAGLCIFAAYLGCRAVEAVSRRGFVGSYKMIGRLGLMLAAAILATLVNPYSTNLTSWLFESLGQPRPEISDWSSDQLFSMIGLKFWALIAVAIGALAFSRKSRDFTHTVILALTLWQAVSHFRHVPFFAILCGFWLAPHLQSTLNVFGKAASASSDNSFLETRRGKLVAALVCTLVCVMIGLQLKGRLSRLVVDRSQYPVDAFQYMHDHSLNGKIVVTYDWAQYVIGAFCVPGEDGSAAESQVAFDGRFRTCYPQLLVDLHFDWLFGDGPDVLRSRSLDSPECDPLAILELNQPDIVINRRTGELTRFHMEKAKLNWVLLYQDKIAQVWGRRTVYDDPALVTYISPNQRMLTNKDVSGYVAWPAFPKSHNSLHRIEPQDSSPTRTIASRD